MSIVELHNVSKSYGRKQVLRDMNLTVQAGEFMVVYGLPVTGKTVLVRLITGLEKPDTGSVMLRGQDMAHLRARRPQHRLCAAIIRPISALQRV